MKPIVLLPAAALFAACLAPGALAQAAAGAVREAPAHQEATRIYRQVLPDGRIVYSDEAVAGARLDHTITMTPPIKGNLWSTEPGQRPKVAPQTTPTPLQRVDPLRTPAPGKSTIAVPDAALAEVMRAEMLLEDAKKRQAAGARALPGEQRDNSDGGLSYNQAYFSRQMRMARDVEYAQDALKKALVTRDGVRTADVRPAR
ncbi:hypothetical protein [Noviherbaspirillum sedimenti]|uniref:DUF4124 domain-containing protein n=1 Tax=Noviherbaspirillum sedimenti TaxID=2320865 RepID=A0A3A3G7I1_9BURK|nr:hypothetical protein [Noviherbaspirillum sedimenti]RJG02512.1 hypothetical protein D3878_13775 [Noviherbaspirillum sedimenti]